MKTELFRKEVSKVVIVWSREEIARELYGRSTTHRPINPTSLPEAMVRAMRKEFGSLDIAYEFFGFDPSGAMRKPVNLSATELIIEIQAWKQQRNRVRFSEMMSERPELVEQIQRTFGDFYTAVYRAGLNPHEEAGELVLGTTLWFNPVDFYLAVCNHWPTFMGYLHGVELPVLAWDIHGQPHLRMITFNPYSPERLVDENLFIGKTWWHDLSIVDMHELAIMSADVFLFGVLSIRQARDPHCLSDTLSFSLDEVVERHPALWWHPSMRECKRDIVYKALNALVICFNFIEYRNGPLMSGRRIINSCQRREEQERREGYSYLSSSKWILRLDEGFFAQWEHGPGKTTPQAGYYAVLPPGVNARPGVPQQIVSLCLNLMKHVEERQVFGQRLLVSQGVKLDLLGTLLWWKEIPEWMRPRAAHIAYEPKGSVIPVWDGRPYPPAGEVQAKLRSLLPRVRDVWPRLRTWEFDDQHIYFIFNPETETQPEAS